MVELDRSADVLSAPSPRKTIYDIASRSGVSPATVSRYLNASTYVSPALRERIAVAIAELDYQPSQAARALAGRRTGIVALAVPGIDNPRWPEVACALEARVADAGLSLVLINLGAGRERELAGLDQVYRIRADALAISMLTYERGDFSRLERAGTHIVSVSNDIDEPSIDAVLPDRLTAVHLAIQHLSALGHRRIALIDGPAVLLGVRRRVAAYREARERAGLAMELENVIHVPEATIADGRAIVDDVLKTGATAVVATNDLLAIGLWMGLEQTGLYVPRDCSIVGMDDIASAALVRTGLTTLAIDRIARGRLAAELLLERIAGTALDGPRQLLIPPRLVRRSTTAPPTTTGVSPSGSSRTGEGLGSPARGGV